MSRQLILGMMVLLSAAVVSGCAKQKGGAPTDSTKQAGHEDPEGYYTCPMHPEVHEHKPGKCPICGMALVKVFENKQETKSAAMSGHTVHATERQINLAGIGKYTVKRKDLLFTVPVAGRLASSREVVFQVYESDIQIVRAGLEFSGRASSSPDEELKGRIRQVDTLIDPASRTVRVVGSLNGPPTRAVVDGGFFGEIESQAKAQLAVPENAVLHSGKRSLVYVISQNNEIKPVAVILGKKASGEYQILSGISEGDVISTGPNFLIDSEAKIRGGSDQSHH